MSNGAESRYISRVTTSFDPTDAAVIAQGKTGRLTELRDMLRRAGVFAEVVRPPGGIKG